MVGFLDKSRRLWCGCFLVFLSFCLHASGVCGFVVASRAADSGSSGQKSWSRSSIMASTATESASSSQQGPSDAALPADVVDRSTLTLLEHVNINVPSHEYILPFYFGLLDLGMDPRKAANLLPDAPKKTLWANGGASQFHLPYGDVAQRIPGKIGLRYESLEGLKQRLAAADTSQKCFKEYEIGVDDKGREFARIVDMYGNVFYCRAAKTEPPVYTPGLRQPIIMPASHATEPWKELAAPYAKEQSECHGIDYVEFSCPINTADKIALFYESVLDATVSVITDGTTKVAVVAFGNIDKRGQSEQSLLFRETSESLPPYDGHHVAMYVGRNGRDFEQAFKNAKLAGIVWVNPRFTDKATTLQGAKKWNQFRFKDIVDMKTGKRIMELEHEMRSVEHEAWPGSRPLDP